MEVKNNSSKYKSLLTKEQMSRLPFIEGSHLYCPDGLYPYIVHSLSTDSFNKISNIFNKSDEITDFSNISYAYILPRGRYKQNDMKEVCKKKNIKITRDISKANIIISNSNLISKPAYANSPNNNSFLFQAYFKVYYSKNLREEDFEPLATLSLAIGKHLASFKETNENGVCYFLPPKTRLYGTINVDRSEHELITDDGLAVLYEILSRKLPVIQDCDLFNTLDKNIIDEDSYQTLDSMLSSNNTGDRDIAKKILYNCDIDKSLYYIRKLSQKHYYSMFYGNGKKTKEHKAFREVVDPVISCTDMPDAIEIFYERKALTKEIYEECCKEALEEIKDTGVFKRYFRSNFLKMNPEIVPYEAYMEIQNSKVK